MPTPQSCQFSFVSRVLRRAFTPPTCHRNIYPTEESCNMGEHTRRQLQMTTQNTQIRGGFRWACTVIIVTALPSLAFGAGPSFRSSGSFRASSMNGQHSFSRPFSGFFGGDDEPVEIIIQQSQSAPITEPTKPAQKGIYVQPHWVDGGYGVQVLEPGHWTDPEKQPGH